jgi:hypothetical protein
MEQLLFILALYAEPEIVALIATCLFYSEETRHNFRNLGHVQIAVIGESDNVGISGGVFAVVLNHRGFVHGLNLPYTYNYNHFRNDCKGFYKKN